jgi:hypothetical protein
MSNSNVFNGGNFQQTPLDVAYNFTSFSDYINNNININNNMLKTNFSHRCIFCSFIESKSLISDGSFRQCNRCNKQFRALIIKNN